MELEKDATWRKLLFQSEPADILMCDSDGYMGVGENEQMSLGTR